MSGGSRREVIERAKTRSAVSALGFMNDFSPVLARDVRRAIGGAVVRNDDTANERARNLPKNEG